MEVNGGSGVDKLGCATVFHGLEVVFVRHCGTGKRRGDDFVVGLGNIYVDFGDGWGFRW